MIAVTIIRRPLAAGALFGIALCLSIPARSDVRQLSLEAPSGDRTVTVETVPFDGIPYVALPTLVNEAGGAFNALPTRLRVDLFGTTAWLRVGESRVHALSIFSLEHPIRERDGETFIAFGDLGDFFLKSFRVQVREVEAAETEPAPPEALEPVAVLPPESAAVIEPLETRTEPVPEPSAVARIRFVLLDPGHGGYSTGLEAPGGFTEKALTLAVATRVRELLASSDAFEVALTRDKDVDMPEMRRSMAINNSQTDILISLHAGSALSSATQGIAVLYPAADDRQGRTSVPPAGPQSAQVDKLRESAAIAQALAAALGRTTGAPVRGVGPAPVRLLSSVNVPAVMVEVGCLTHPQEAERLGTEEYQRRLAQGIVEGLAAYANPAPVSSQSRDAPEAPPARRQEQL